MWRVKKKEKRERPPETNPTLLGVCYFICCVGEEGGGQTEGWWGRGADRGVGGGRGVRERVWWGQGAFLPMFCPILCPMRQD